MIPKSEPEKGRAITDRGLIVLLWRFVAPYRRSVVIVFVLLLAVTLLSLLPPYLVQRTVDGPILHHDLPGLVPYGVLYFLIILLTFCLRLSHTILLQWVGQKALMNLRQTLFEHILKQDMAYFNHTPVGQMVSRLSNDVDALTELLSTSIVMVASNAITLVGIIVVMFALNWRLALLGLGVLPIMIVATVYFRQRIRVASANWHKVIADYLALLNEQLSGMWIVQLFERQEASRAEFQSANTAYTATRLKVRDEYTLYGAILQLLTAVGLALVLYGGGNGVLAGWATLGMLISFVQYTQRSFDPILQLSEQFAQIQTALAAAERIARMLQITPSVTESPNPVRLANFAGRVTFDHVEFGYEPGTPVVRDVNVDIPPGQSVAIVGATGAGKTSLVGLLARFYDVERGRVLLDGIDIRQIARSDLGKYVTVVPQNPYCFNGTIADNLRLFDQKISHERIVSAARTACASTFIERLPGQYDYPLQPGGANLSQGQRQLLALARALIHSPEGILVLDEATSNVDTETEALIQEGLKRVLRTRTSIIIAHRLSTVREVDRILVIQHGQIVEDGSAEQLLARNGLYAQLVRRQFAGRINTQDARHSERRAS
jgi:ATP-binding cassette subfamily B multidrug efflux pump